MNEVEFIARWLCARDGIHPDAIAMSADRQEWTNKTVKLPPTLEQAWKFYYGQAALLLEAQSAFQKVSEGSRAAQEEAALSGWFYEPATLRRQS